MAGGWIAWRSLLSDVWAAEGGILFVLGAIQLRFLWPLIMADGPETIDPDRP